MSAGVGLLLPRPPGPLKHLSHHKVTTTSVNNYVTWVGNGNNNNKTRVMQNVADVKRTDVKVLTGPLVGHKC